MKVDNAQLRGMQNMLDNINDREILKNADQLIQKEFTHITKAIEAFGDSDNFSGPNNKLSILRRVRRNTQGATASDEKIKQEVVASAERLRAGLIEVGVAEETSAKIATYFSRIDITAGLIR